MCWCGIGSRSGVMGGQGGRGIMCWCGVGGLPCPACLTLPVMLLALLVTNSLVTPNCPKP